MELWRRLLQENFYLHLVSNSEQTCKNKLLCADVHWSHVALEKLCPPMAKRRTTNVLMYVTTTNAAFYPRIFKVGRQTDIFVTEPRTGTGPNLYKQNRLVSSRASVQMLTLFCSIWHFVMHERPEVNKRTWKDLQPHTPQLRSLILIPQQERHKASWENCNTQTTAGQKDIFTKSWWLLGYSMEWWDISEDMAQLHLNKAFCNNNIKTWQQSNVVLVAWWSAAAAALGPGPMVRTEVSVGSQTVDVLWPHLCGCHKRKEITKWCSAQKHTYISNNSWTVLWFQLTQCR